MAMPNSRSIDERTPYVVQPTHGVAGKGELLALIGDFRDGIPVKEVEDAYPSVLEDLQVTKLFLVQSIARPVLG